MIVQIVAIVIAWALTVPLALGFFKAGRFKLTATTEVMVGAGMGWVGNAKLGTVRLVGLLEVLGAAGVVLAPIASEFLGWSWAQPIGALAAAGLALTMVGAMILHRKRNESQYTLKMNLTLLANAVAVGVLLAVFGAPLF